MNELALKLAEDENLVKIQFTLECVCQHSTCCWEMMLRCLSQPRKTRKKRWSNFFSPSFFHCAPPYSYTWRVSGFSPAPASFLRPKRILLSFFYAHRSGCCWLTIAYTIHTICIAELQKFCAAMYQIRKLEIFSVNGSGNNSDSSSTQKNVLNKNLIIKIIVMKVLKSRIGRKTTMSAKITVEEIRNLQMSANTMLSWMP